jgi:hypothetical protein
MQDETLIRQRFERMSRSEVCEELTRSGDYTPEAFKILEEMARERGIDVEPLINAQSPKSTWRRELKAGEVRDWYRLFDIAGYKDESAIANRDLSESVARLLAGMLIVDGLFILGVLFALLYFAGGIMGYVFGAGGYFLAMRTILRSKDPLEQRRWKRCLQGNVVGYHVTAVALISLVAGPFKTFDEFITGIIVYLCLACLGGILAGLLWAQICDKKDKAMVLDAFRAWQIDREAGETGTG